MNGPALAVAGAGIIVLVSGIKGYSITQVIQDIVTGQDPRSALANQFTAASSSASTPPPSGGSGTPSPSGGGAVTSPSALQAYAFSLFPGYGWGTDQEQPLVNLWNRESSWNVHAYYPSTTTNNPDPNGSRAYGIPQALPPGKMASAGADWVNNGQTQIRWGLGYISSVYHNPQGAWAHEESQGWY